MGWTAVIPHVGNFLKNLTTDYHRCRIIDNYFYFYQIHFLFEILIIILFVRYNKIFRKNNIRMSVHRPTRI